MIPRLYIYAAAALAIVSLIGWQRHAGYESGKAHVHAQWDAALAKATIEAAKTAAADKAKVEAQDEQDRQTIADLNTRLQVALARPDLPPRIVRVCQQSGRSVPASQANAGSGTAGQASGSAVPDATDFERGVRAFRADLLRFAKACADDNVAAVAAREQWPR